VCARGGRRLPRAWRGGEQARGCLADGLGAVGTAGDELVQGVDRGDARGEGEHLGALGGPLAEAFDGAPDVGAVGPVEEVVERHAVTAGEIGEGDLTGEVVQQEFLVVALGVRGERLPVERDGCGGHEGDHSRGMEGGQRNICTTAKRRAQVCHARGICQFRRCDAVSCDLGRGVSQAHEVVCLDRCGRVTSPLFVGELNFEGVWAQLFNDGADLATGQIERGLIGDQGDDVKELQYSCLHH